MNVDIKQISRSESHFVIDLFDQYRVFYKQASDKRLAEEFINERLERNESVIFVAFNRESDKAVPVGFTQLYPKYSSARAIKNWILNDLYVEAGFRKKGIGAKLIKAAMEFAKSQGARFVQLETAVDNYTAQSLYESIGFKKQEPDTEFLMYRIEV